MSNPFTSKEKNSEGMTFAEWYAAATASWSRCANAQEMTTLWYAWHSGYDPADYNAAGSPMRVRI